MGEMEVMDAPNFTALTAEDLLTLIEDAGKILDQKIAAEKADIEERQIKLTKLLARRAGKDVKAAKKKDVKAAKKAGAPKPRSRAAAPAAPKPAEQAAQVAGSRPAEQAAQPTV